MAATKGKKKSGNNKGKEDNHESRKGKGTSTNANNSDRRRIRNMSKRNDGHLRAAVEEDGSYEIVEMAADGNCLFRSISDQLYYDYGSRHEQIRSEICDYLEAREEDFRDFLVLDENDDDEEAAPDFNSYVKAMRNDGTWGGNLELVVAARLYQRNITVFHLAVTLDALHIAHGSDDKKSVGRDIQLSYHENHHYNSVRSTSLPRPEPPMKKVVDNATTFLDDGSDDQFEMSKADALPDPTDSKASSQDPADTKAVEQAEKPVRVTRKGPCPCGSGQPFKKCCMAKRKHQTHLQRVRGGGGGVEKSDDESELEIRGGFRVLKI